MKKSITETYRETEIIYLEDPNKWRFTANGRERSAESLVKARESIDRALDHERKVKAWEPFEAWTCSGYGSQEWRKVKVTSQAERDYGTTEFWISEPSKPSRFGGKKNERSKVAGMYLYKVTPENDALISEIQSLNAQVDALTEQAGKLKKQMQPIAVEEIR